MVMLRHIIGADGSKTDMTCEELADLEVPKTYVERHWHDAITVPRCKARAIMKKLAEDPASPYLPSEQQ